MPTRLNAAKVKRKLKKLIDPLLARALAHPIRGHILVRLGERGTMSASQMADELGVESSDLSYHFRLLRKMRLIGQPQRVKRRGFTEHLYQLADPVMYFDDREWNRIPKNVRKRFNINLIQGILEEAVEAVNLGALSDRPSHVSRVWMVADKRGRDEIMEFEETTLKKRLAMKSRIEKRIAGSDEARIPITLTSVCFQRTDDAAEA